MSSLTDLYMTELASPLYGPNPYSQYSNAALPMPGYQGWPTNAMGRQIPGVTLNSPPGQTQAAANRAATAQPDLSNMFGGTTAQMFAQSQNISPQAQIAGMANALPGGNNPTNAAYGAQLLNQAGAFGQPTPTPPPGTTGTPLTRDMYLSMLANPGNPRSTGATVPQINPGQGPSVLQKFLQSQQGGAGAGNYSNAPFFSTLNALQGGR